MKSLEILKSMLNISSVQIELFEYCLLNDVKEAIKDLEELQNNINSSIEEIEYALAKPDYADVYLNNALRFLKERS